MGGCTWFPTTSQSVKVSMSYHLETTICTVGYNLQAAICDEYIAVIDVKPYASDMECFVPLMEKYMKFTMYKKETTDKKYHKNPYRAISFAKDADGNLLCPNGRKFLFKRTQHVKYNKYGRTEEFQTYWMPDADRLR